MRIYLFLLVALFLGLFTVLDIKSQTLFNGVGHIPTYYQETWDVAGLLNDMSAVEPKLVVPINPGAASSQVTTAINTARNHVTTTGGLAIIYFPQGTYYLTSTITLTQNERNIVFQ